MIAIVTDSTAYLTHEEAARLGVVVVPMSYSLEGGASISEGNIEENDDCEQMVKRYMGTIHTSQAALSAFHATFSRLRRAGFEVLCLPMSSHLSGTCANAVLAARELGGPIRVVDSLSTCAGLYLLIRRACAMVQAGESLEKVEAEMIALREKGRTYFSVDDMTPLRRSGRLGNVKSSISTILNFKPLLAVREGRRGIRRRGSGQDRPDAPPDQLCRRSPGLIGWCPIFWPPRRPATWKNNCSSRAGRWSAAGWARCWAHIWAAAA